VASLHLECMLEVQASGTSLWAKLGPTTAPVASCYPSHLLLLLLLLLFPFGAAVIFIFTHIYKDIEKFVPLGPCAPASNTSTSWGPKAQFRHARPLYQEASTIDCHDCVLHREGHRVAPAQIFFEFRTLGKVP
jgi:hypothetical protein